MTDGFREIGRSISNWGRWGAADTLGTLNLITPQLRAEAARLVRTGVSVPLGLAFDRDGPQHPEGLRQNPVHLMTRLGDSAPAPGGAVRFDDAVFLHTRCATHVDALAQVAYDGAIFNGHAADSVTHRGATEFGVERMRGGIQGRGVLLDLPRSTGRDRWEAGEAVRVDDLERAAAFAHVEVRPGDVVLLRTGWMSVFTRDRDRRRYVDGEPGIVLAVAPWLHERDVAFLASDTPAGEVSPGERADEGMPVNAVLIRDVGMPLGKMFDLDAVAAHCAETGVWEFQFSCLPLPLTGGVASPVAPVATF